MTTDPRSEAIKAMGEVISAQALHIEKLEAGHWSKHTRKRVDRAKRKLNEVTATEELRESFQEEHEATYQGGKIPEDGMFGNSTGTHYSTPGTCPTGLDLKPEGHWACSLPDGHGQMHHLIYTGPAGNFNAPSMYYGGETTPSCTFQHPHPGQCETEDGTPLLDISEHPLAKTYHHNHPQDLGWAENAWAKHKEAKHHNHPDDGTKEPGCPRCQADAGGLIALLALHGDKAGAERLLNNLLTTGDISDPPEPQQPMIEDCNAARQVAPSMRAPLPGEPSMFDKGGPLPCTGRRTDDGAPCTLNAPHVWPHMWPASVQDDETAGDRCPATNLGAGWGRCTRTTGHIGAHQYAEAETE